MISIMEIEFDIAKSERNQRERGFGFDFAALIFLGLTIEWDDVRKNYGERQIIALGQFEGETYVLVYTWRGDRRRIISARRAKAGERNAYRKTFPG